MSTRSFLLPPDLAAYYGSIACGQPPELAALAASSDALAEARMRSSPEAGRLLALLVRLMGAKHVFEVGVFTGYGTAWLAGAVPPGGEVVALDVTDEHLGPGRDAWRAMGLADRVRVLIGDAREGLASLLADRGAGSFDFGFVDADKAGYPEYYDLGKRLLRPGGLLVFDNALLHGQVADAGSADPDVRAIRSVNATAFADPEVEASLLILGDGLLLVRKR